MKKRYYVYVVLLILVVILVFVLFLIKKSPKTILSVVENKKFYDVETPKQTTQDFDVSPDIKNFGEMVIQKPDPKGTGTYSFVGVVADAAYSEDGNWFLPVVISDTEKVLYNFGSGKNMIEVYTKGNPTPKIDRVETLLPEIAKGQELVVPFNFDIDFTCPKEDEDLCKKVIDAYKKEMETTKQLFEDRESKGISLDNMKLGRARTIILGNEQK